MLTLSRGGKRGRSTVERSLRRSLLAFPTCRSPLVIYLFPLLLILLHLNNGALNIEFVNFVKHHPLSYDDSKRFTLACFFPHEREAFCGIRFKDNLYLRQLQKKGQGELLLVLSNREVGIDESC